MGIVRKVSISLLISFFCFGANAQLCQGSLGDPIVNITFGAGSNPGASLVAATTAYQYVPNDCPNDGFYTVRNNTSNCFSTSWHSLVSDHTGDPNGYFMLVNASVQPSAFYIDTVKGLCSNTTFEFAAWIMNVLRTTACNANGIQPNLTFTIERTDGTVLQTYNTGNISSQANPSWQQFGFFFTTPVGVADIVLRIFNNSQGGCGNDLALDDITFRPCGPLLTPSIVGLPTATANFCEGIATSYTFNATISAGFANPSFQWQQSTDGITWTDIPGANNNTFLQNFPANTTIGNYKFRLTAAETGNLNSTKCRVVSAAISIQVVANPVTTATSNSPLCEGTTMQLTATGGTQYQWSGVSGFTATGNSITINNVQSAQAGKYYVLVRNAAGCDHLDSAIVTINPKPVATTNFTSATICAGENIQLIAGGGGSYQWLPSSGLSAANIFNPMASPVDTVQYLVIVTNQFGCADSATVDLYVKEKPVADAGADKVIFAGTPIQLAGVVAGQDISYSWSPSQYMDNPQLLRPIVTPPVDMDYTLTVVSNVGCGTATDKVHVFVYKDIYIPTGFTPDGNGKNDVWFVPALSAFNNFEVFVYNRYGQIVFQTKNINQPWDGKYNGELQPSGTYVYLIDLKQEGKLFKGIVSIIR